MIEDQILKKFIINDVAMWNPNTNYLVYINHFEDIMKYCIKNKTNKILYTKWLEILDTGSPSSKIGSETHNICHGLGLIDSGYSYHFALKPQNEIEIIIPNDILFQYYMDNKISDNFWKIVTKKFLNFYKNNDVFNLEKLNHIQMLCLNIYVCLLLDTKQANISELKNEVYFAKNQSASDVENKINKVYSYDICKKDANILEKMNLTKSGVLTNEGSLFIRILSRCVGGIQGMFSIYSNTKEKGAQNRIYYGAPGCGKSWKIKNMLSNISGVEEKNIIRTVFHPEYSNTDFVGQILPYVDNNIVSYKFKPGPFANALTTAYGTDDMVYLIIEEINRGNAAAIFGDLFQLLDREKAIDDNNKPNPRFGASEYYIDNPTLETYIRDYFKKEAVDLGENFHIQIPTNLTILATMNTSDQNVFTLDTAFKRRWYFEQVPNDIAPDTNHIYKHYYVPGTDVTWEQFMITINNKILDSKIQNQINEDKRMGKYFVTMDCLTKEPNDKKSKDAASNFAYKVLEYLWNDVCKIGKEEWFVSVDKENRTLEDLINNFMYNKNGDPLSIFNNIKFK